MSEMATAEGGSRPHRIAAARRHRRALSVLLVVLAAAIALRVALVERHSLWSDEVFSLAMATGHSLEHAANEAEPDLGDYVELPALAPATVFRRYLEHEPRAGLARVLRAVRLSDTSPPLYYLLLNRWTQWVGVTDAGLRLFSVLWAVAAMPLLWTLARRLGGEPAALPAALLFAFSPVGLFYSTEGRMYSLVWFLTLALIALTLALRSPGAGFRRLGAWSVVGAAGLLTHYFYFFVWSACVVWLVVTPWRLRRMWLAAGIGMVALLALPWYVTLPETLGRWRVTGSWLQAPVSLRRTLVAPFQLGWSFLSGRGYWDSSARAEWLAFAVFAALAIVLLLGLRHRLFAGESGLVWSCLAASCLGPVAFDLVRGTMTATIPRYALAGLPTALMLAALALGRLWAGFRVVALILVLLAWSSGVYAIWRSPSRHSEPYRQVAATLDAGVGAEGLVLVHSIPSGVLGIARYVDGRLMVGSWVGQLGRRQVPVDVQALTAGRAKVVLVKIHEVGEPAPEEAWLRAHAALVSESRHEAARLSVFVPRSGDRFSWSEVSADDAARR